MPRKHTSLIINDEHATIGGVDGKKVFVIDNEGNQIVDFGGSNVAYVQYDPDDSVPTYIGTNESADATDGSTDWTIYKFLYSGSNATSIRRKTGAWSNRASLF